MSKDFFISKKVFPILTFLSFLVISSLFILTSNFKSINRNEIILPTIVFSIFISIIYISTQRMVLNITSKSSVEFLKSSFFKEYLTHILSFFISLLILLIFFEMFHYLGYGEFNSTYISNVLSGNVNNGKVFVESSKELKSFIYNILVVNAFYIEMFISVIKFIIIFPIIIYIRNKILNSKPVV